MFYFFLHLHLIFKCYVNRSYRCYVTSMLQVGLIKTDCKDCCVNAKIDCIIYVFYFAHGSTVISGIRHPIFHSSYQFFKCRIRTIVCKLCDTSIQPRQSVVTQFFQSVLYIKMYSFCQLQWRYAKVNIILKYSLPI